MDERIKQLRKALNLNQTEFGNRIGVKQGTIAGYESGARVPLDSVVLSICREFRVNYYWLTEGQGEMFTGTPKTVVDELAEEYSLDDIDKKIIEKYLELDPEKRKILKEYLKSIFT